eukprot:SAG31_NODE_312_length_17856_cov_14.557827_13_plen_146_part_00
MASHERHMCSAPVNNQRGTYMTSQRLQLCTIHKLCTIQNGSAPLPAFYFQVPLKAPWGSARLKRGAWIASERGPCSNTPCTRLRCVSPNTNPSLQLSFLARFLRRIARLMRNQCLDIEIIYVRLMEVRESTKYKKINFKPHAEST